ncbi:carbohydrate ABC transporter permease [Nonomuraea endophytica]|uniref:Multiple sugar transport system permease protein n=1 Tax=Nonomuraea endophytica TaxID=714136 RepID=A0A7W8ABX7_9ACTN|nr:carbohydrate ABC transporter permease [Nonomuraea endophytica]MBB5083332.1 multiple sugar transport system permease protein [Nonomuraea endophytica]
MRRALGWACLILAIVISLFPLYWMIRTAMTPGRELAGDNSGFFPQNPTLFNFERVLGLVSPEESRAAGGSGAELNFFRYLGNSIVYTGLITIFQTLFCGMAGYAFARLQFFGRDVLFGLFVGALMVPPIFTLLPNFVLVKELGLLDSTAGLIAPSLLMTPFAVFFLRQFFLGFPREVEQAALIDGATKWTIFWRVVLPMTKGPLFTLALTTAVWTWNDYLWPLLVAPGEDTRVLTTALGLFLKQSPNTHPDWTGLMAGSVLSVIPVLLLVAVFGRRLVDSIQFSGMKG